MYYNGNVNLVFLPLLVEKVKTKFILAFMKINTYEESFKLMIMDLYKGGQSMSSLLSEYS